MESEDEERDESESDESPKKKSTSKKKSSNPAKMTANLLNAQTALGAAKLRESKLKISQLKHQKDMEKFMENQAKDAARKNSNNAMVIANEEDEIIVSDHPDDVMLPKDLQVEEPSDLSECELEAGWAGVVGDLKR